MDLTMIGILIGGLLLTVIMVIYITKDRREGVEPDIALNDQDLENEASLFSPDSHGYASTETQPTHAMPEGDQQNTEYEKRFYQGLKKISVLVIAKGDLEQFCQTFLLEVSNLIPFDAACVLELNGTRSSTLFHQGYDAFENGVPDINLDVEEHPAIRRVAFSEEPLIGSEPFFDNLHPFRSTLGMPIRAGGETLGLVILEHTSEDAYTNQHREVLEALAGQVALIFQNIRLRTHMETRLARERRLNEMMRAITSELDLPLILQQVVRMAAELLQADGGALGLLSPDQHSLEYAYLYNLPQSLREQPELRNQGPSWSVLDTGQSISIEDYPAHPGALPAWVQAGLHACLVAPVTAVEEQLGVLWLFQSEAGHVFNVSDLAVVELIGRQAGIAIQNVRLFELERQRADEFEALRATLADISAELELSRLLGSILERASQLLLATGGELGRFIPETQEIEILTSHNMSGDYKGVRLKLGEGAMGKVVKTGEALIIDDYQVWEGRSQQFAKSPCRAVMAAPLVVRGRMLGAISIMDTRPDHHFTPTDLNLLILFAQQAAVAVDNASLFDNVQRLATLDSLTGLFNRRHFFDLARREYERAVRYGHPLSAVMLDIDRFKRVNDTYGHAAGDHVLQSVARLLREKLREVDILARYGGEEFVILLPNTTLQGARQVAERLHHSVSKLEIHSNGARIQVTISLGVSQLGTRCPSLDALLECADQALYTAKQSGRDQVMVWSA